MISFSLDDDERLLASSARSFARGVLRPRLRAHEEARKLSDETRRAFHELGLCGMDLPAELGFGGLSLTARALIEEELAAGDLGAAVALDGPGLAGELIRRLGTDEQKRRLLGPFVDDPLRRAALCIGDSRALGGGSAQLFVLLDRDLRASVAEATAEEDRDALGLAEAPPAKLSARAVEPLGDARQALRAALVRFAAIDAARATGCAQASFEHALKYAEERQAFGKPIGHFQSIAFLLSDLAIEVEGLRALAWRACRAVDLQQPDAELCCAQAAAQARESLQFVTSSAVQILGGAGFVQDHPVEKWMRDARTLALRGLTAEAARSLCAHAQLGSAVPDAELFNFVGPQAVLT